MPDHKSRPNRPNLYVVHNPHHLPPPHVTSEERVILFDGECPLCRRLVTFLIQADPQQRIRLATVQSPPGQDLLRWASLPVDHFSTVAYIANGQVSVRSEAFFNALAQLGWPWRALGIFRVLPRPLRDALYNLVARNRYRWFGQLPPGSQLPDDKRGSRYLTHGQDTPKSGGLSGLTWPYGDENVLVQSFTLASLPVLGVRYPDPALPRGHSRCRL